MMNDDTATRFTEWFKQHGTQSDALGLTSFPDMGRGAVALENIPEDTILFSIPRTLLLNTANSKLQSLLTSEEWTSLKNWTPLILTMMWESRQPDSLWKPYFDIMPVQFDSLMFWSEDELKELEGCAVLAKIGKDEAMQDFNDIIQPLVAARPDVFGSAEYYNEDLYNHMGSLILSRSFHVDDPEESEDKDDESSDEENENEEAETSTASLMRAADGMDIHNDTGLLDEAEDGEEDDEDDEDEEDEVTHISMVPWADMLNARHGCDNARLFYEKDCLNMTSTKAIRKGEQIWNVYGDPPNSDLLRRYGHVDEHNPADVVEITADLVADVACNGSDKEERIETLLEVDLDDTYNFTLENHEDELLELLSAVYVFQADSATLIKIQKKGKVSKKGLMNDLDLLKLALTIFERRLAQYPHDFDNDTQQLETVDDLPIRTRHAITVRHSEMRILRSLIEEVKMALPAESNDRKRGRDDDDAPRRSKPMSKKDLREEKKRLKEEEKLLGESSAKRSRK